MTRVQLANPAETTPNRQAVLEQIINAFGATPNMFKAVANSPAALKSIALDVPVDFPRIALTPVA